MSATTANPVNSLTKNEILQALAAGSIDATEASQLLSQLEPPTQPASKPSGNGRKTTCPISREDFQEHAKALEVSIGDSKTLADVKDFSTGSFGWYTNGKMNVKVAGKIVTVQVGITLTVIGSKEV